MIWPIDNQKGLIILNCGKFHLEYVSKFSSFYNTLVSSRIFLCLNYNQPNFSLPD